MAKTTDTTCGAWNFRPAFLQRFTTPRWFMVVYGLLGTVQAMSFIYFVVVLTTMEKRFKIPSKTTGIMLSGNEISQVLLSLFLSYFGGQRNRPKWIAWGVVLCSLSCFILALPHYLYGAGEDALALTKEYSDVFTNATSLEHVSKTKLCSTSRPDEVCRGFDTLGEFSLLPVVLVFLSQFVLGIGNTLYYALGNTYMDDNTKKTNTPMLLGYTSALRTLGPVFGFILGPICLSFYIDPSLTPLITKTDTRWLGAWWLGWIILGVIMFFLSFLIGFFPKHLPRKEKKAPEVGLPQYPKCISIITNKTKNDEIPLSKNSMQSLEAASNQNIPQADSAVDDKKKFPTMKELPTALSRLLKNKILMCNSTGGVFYILGASAYITFMARYIEVQYSRPSATSTMFAGPGILFGMVTGFLVSGWYISRKKPRARILMAWNVMVGIVYMTGQIAFMFMSCPKTSIEQQLLNGGRQQLILDCNSNCMCDSVKYDPVCHKPTGQIYFSPCHAGCMTQESQSQQFSNCSCIVSNPAIKLLNNQTGTWTGPDYKDGESDWNIIHGGACGTECLSGYILFMLSAMVINVLGSSARISNILVNYRCVEVRDKSFAQGLLLLMLSLFALIPGPIIYGVIIDSTCIEWGEECGKSTNCLIYDKDLFRIYINVAAFLFTSIGVFFDGIVWYLSKDLDLYGEKCEEQEAKEVEK